LDDEEIHVFERMDKPKFDGHKSRVARRLAAATRNSCHQINAHGVLGIR
jgi:hypothetical protein